MPRGVLLPRRLAADADPVRERHRHPGQPWHELGRPMRPSRPVRPGPQYLLPRPLDAARMASVRTLLLRGRGRAVHQHRRGQEQLRFVRRLVRQRPCGRLLLRKLRQPPNIQRKLRRLWSDVPRGQHVPGLNLHLPSRNDVLGRRQVVPGPSREDGQPGRHGRHVPERRVVPRRRLLHIGLRPGKPLWPGPDDLWRHWAIELVRVSTDRSLQLAEYVLSRESNFPAVESVNAGVRWPDEPEHYVQQSGDRREKLRELRLRVSCLDCQHGNRVLLRNSQGPFQ